MSTNDAESTGAARQKRAPGAQRSNRNAVKHGIYARNAGRIDRRRAVDRRVLETIAAIEQAIGPRLTPQRALILANVGRRLRDLARIEAYEDELGTIIARRKRAAWPITEAKWKLLDAINRDLERIGLDVEKRLGPTLDDIRARYAERERYGGRT